MQYLNIQPLNIEGLSYFQNRAIETRLLQILHEWEDTPYCPGQQCKGVAVDCVRFVAAVIDEMLGMETPMARLPQDASFHNPELARRGMREFLTRYPSVKAPDVLEPGDVIVMGPRSGGPGHAAIIGLHGYWHCGQFGVNMAGRAFPDHGVYYFKEARRAKDRSDWFNRLTGGDNGK
jgi:hypothetical protein